MTKQMEFHEAANIFPLDDEHMEELADDIKAHGQLCPIELIDGKILDGRRRWMACLQAGVEPDTINVDATVDDPVAYVMSLNLHRRHLTKSQASMCADKARAMYDKAAKERQKARKGNQPGATPEKVPDLCKGDSRDQVGEAFGVSGRLVDKATQVRKNGIPDLVKAVEDGKVTVSKAREICCNPEALQKELLAATLSSGKAVQQQKATPKKAKEKKPEGASRGVGIQRANEAINCLSRIPKNDGLRKRGFQLVSDWIKANK